ncbi:MAG TPA: S8 family serine peptidase [bacterium]|nr:S8 family serine peptidase [bacterium]
MRPIALSVLFLGAAAAPSGAQSAPDLDEFPVEALLPRAEIGADRFLAEFPDYDGRGVVVAIFDTGVDPGAPGLQVTSDGRPKIVDIVDGSGSGDVDTRTVRTAGDDGTFEGLSGRTLRPDPSWTNPTGEWRVGMKPGWEIFPRGLLPRIKEERADEFREAQRGALAAAREALEDWDAAHPSPDSERRRARADLEARVEELEAMAGKREDPGPVYDCVVFHDGVKWRAAVDTDEDGDLSDETLLTDFRDERRYATFGERDLLNFVLNIYEDGDRLSIVADVGGHGTHVAGIVAAHYPDEPERSGAAPGAQIVSVKIGDSRLGATSVGTGDVRGYVTSLLNGVDVVNMSYGGPDRVLEAGRLDELRHEFVSEQGVIFVSTAGNSGPAISSVGGPGGTSNATFGVGAVISPAMMEALYAVREPYPMLPYQWSSRGPAADGYLAVDFCAPGGAIAPVPNWELKGSALMNGTSMAAPSVAGGVALLLSGMKDRGLEWSPHSVRRALAATAAPIPGAEPWAQGAGVVQIDEAWRSLTAGVSRDDRAARYDVTVPSREGARGIYLRDPFENDRPLELDVRVDPVFPRDSPHGPKVDFEKRIRLRSTVEWIDTADALLVVHGGRGFEVRVDPRGLPAGIHFGEVVGTDFTDPAAGPLFRFPVTVVRTMRVTADDDWTFRETVSLSAGTIVRRFLEPPEGATWADIRIRRTGAVEAARTLVLHAVQLIPDRAFADHDVRAYLELDPGEEAVRSLAVTSGRTLEVALAQSWASLGETQAEIEVAFRGIVPSERRIAWSARDMVPLDVTAPFRAESVAPEGKLDVLRRTLLPDSTAVTVLDARRDSLWDGRRESQIVARYSVEIEAGKWTFRPVFALAPHAGEEFESILWSVRDENGRVLEVGAGADNRPVELPEGKLTVLLHVRHEDPARLEAAVAVGLYADRELKKPVALGVHASSDGAMEGKDKLGRIDLNAGESVRAWLAPVPADDWPDGAEPGDVLLGALTLGTDGDPRGGAGRRPDGWPVEVTLGAKSKKQKKDGAGEEDDGEEDEDDALREIAEDVRDLKVKKLGELADRQDDEAFRKLAKEILSDWPDHLPVLSAKLRQVDGEDGGGPVKDVVAAADQVIAAVDRRALAEHFGTEIDPEDPAAQEEREERTEERAALRDALYRKARALAAAAAESPEDEAARARLDDAWVPLEKWADPKDDKILDLRADRERLHGRPGSALTLLNDRLDEPGAPRSVYEKRLAVLEELGWAHWVESERRAIAVRFPVETFVY